MGRSGGIVGAAAALGLAAWLSVVTVACGGADAARPAPAAAGTVRSDRPADTIEPAAWTAAEPEVETTAAPAQERFQPVHKGALRPGVHVAARFDPAFFFRVGPAWRARSHRFAIVELTRGIGRNLAFLRAPLYVFDPRTSLPVAAPLDLLPWIRAHPCVTKATKPLAVTVGGYRGTQFDFVVASRPGCTAAWFEIGDGLVYRFDAGEKDRMIVLWINARGGFHQLIVDISTVDPARFEAFAAQSAKVLESVGFR